MIQAPTKLFRRRLLHCAVLFFLGLATAAIAADEGPSEANTSQGFSPIDLTPFYDLHADERSQFGTWEVVPKGRQLYDGVLFNVDGMVRLFGRVPPPHQTIYRNEVTDIPVGRAFEQLHILHGTGWTTEDGEIIAHVVLNYADDEQVSFPIIYGRHVRDWWHRDLLAPGDVTDSNSGVAWIGHHGVGLRLYRTSLTNPHPEKGVRTIDIVSTRSAVTPAILSLTVGPEVLPRPGARGKSISDEDDTILFQVYEAGTEEGVAEAGLHLTYRTKATYAYWGSFSTGPEGLAEITYPDAELEWLSVTVFATGRKPQSITWHPGRGEEIPLWHIFHLEKTAEAAE